MLNLSKAIGFANLKHAGQRDKGGNSYIRHCLRVMEKMDSEDEMIVAVLHDVLEDTDATKDDLALLGLTETQIMAVDALTKRKDEFPEDYMRRIKQSTVARKVKIADIEDNTNIWRLKNRDRGLDEKDIVRLNKYMKMYTELKGI
jgi:(p)ppGpp synthase/HD superfamily hydrolase